MARSGAGGDWDGVTDGILDPEKGSQLPVVGFAFLDRTLTEIQEFAADTGKVSGVRQSDEVEVGRFAFYGDKERL